MGFLTSNPKKGAGAGSWSRGKIFYGSFSGSSQKFWLLAASAPHHWSNLMLQIRTTLPPRIFSPREDVFLLCGNWFHFPHALLIYCTVSGKIWCRSVTKKSIKKFVVFNKGTYKLINVVSLIGLLFAKEFPGASQL
jgi:hypothetical protein